MHPRLENLSPKVSKAIQAIDQLEFPVTMERILKEANLQLSVLEHLAPRQEIFDFVVEVVRPLGYFINEEKQFDLPPLLEESKSSIETPWQEPSILPRPLGQKVEKKGRRHSTDSNADRFGDHDGADND